MQRRENTDVGTHNKFCRFVNQYEEHPLSEIFNNQFFKTKMKMTIEGKKNNFMMIAILAISSKLD